MKFYIVMILGLGISAMAGASDKSIFDLAKGVYKDPSQIAQILSLNGKECGVFNLITDVQFQGYVAAGYHVDEIELSNGEPGQLKISTHMTTGGTTPFTAALNSVCYK